MKNIWWSFKVWVPPTDEGGEGYEYNDQEQGFTLAEAKAEYLRYNSGVVILAGGEAEEED